MSFMREWLAATGSLLSPELYRWAVGMALLSAGIGRKAWTPWGTQRTYPAFSTMLVGESGTGKGEAINTAIHFAELALPDVFSPDTGLILDSGSDVGLLDSLARNRDGRTLIIAEEAATLIKSSKDYAGTDLILELTRILNWPDTGFGRHYVRAKSIPRHVSPVMILGTTLDGARLFPTKGQQLGFAGRLLVIYSNAFTRMNGWSQVANLEAARASYIETINRARGAMKVTKGAREVIVEVQRIEPTGNERMVTMERRRAQWTTRIGILLALDADSTSLQQAHVETAWAKLQELWLGIEAVAIALGSTEFWRRTELVAKHIKHAGGNGIKHSKLMRSLGPDMRSAKDLAISIEWLEGQGDVATEGPWPPRRGRIATVYKWKF